MVNVIIAQPNTPSTKIETMQGSIEQRVCWKGRGEKGAFKTLEV